MSIKDQLDQYTTYVGQAEKDLTDIKTALTNKQVTVPSSTKLSGIPALIGQVQTGSKIELVITAPDYEGEQLTATKGSKSFKGTVSKNECRIEVDEEGSWKVSASDGQSITIETLLTYKATLTKYERNKIYGVRITETESDPEKRVTYIEEATGRTPIKVDQSSGTTTYNNWDKTWIFEKIYPVMLNTNGTIAYRLNPNDYSKKDNGASSDVANINFDGNAMLCVEKFYTKFSMNGSNEEIRISDTKQSGYEAIGFIREDGSEADRVFLPMFMGSFDNSSKLRSISGQNIKYSTSFTDFRTAAQKNGSTYDIETWAMNQMLQAVYYILMKNCNPQTAIGAGRNYNDGSSKTGLMNSKGPIAYDPTTKAVKFMHVEDFTSNYSNGMRRFEAGILSQNSKIYIKMKPPYSGTSTSGYSQVSDYVQAASQYISKMKCSNSYGRYPIAYEGTNSTYEAAYWYGNSASSIYVSLRGSFYGVAGRNFINDASYSPYNYGAALSFVPPA